MLGLKTIFMPMRRRLGWVYKLLVPAGSKRFVGADFISVDDEGAETIYITDSEVEATLAQQPLRLPI